MSFCAMLSLLLLCAAPSLQSTDPVHPDLVDFTPRWRQAMGECGVAALAMALVEGDEVVHRVTLGRRDPERELPVTKDTLFYIASATKPYVAFALAQLAEQGKVDLDAPVKKYLPRFQLADAALSASITVRDLLCHRHGLSRGPIVLLDAYTGEITEDRYYHFLATLQPARRVVYSNLHFTLAGRVIEAVSGQPWREYLKEHVFAPAGMTRTSGYADWMYAQEDVAFPAVFAGDQAVRAPHKSDHTMHAAGGLGTSIDDFTRWIRLQLGRGEIDGVRVLGPEATEKSWELLSTSRDDADFGPTEGFALGWQRGSYRGHLELRHGGGYTGSASYVCFLPELGLGLAVLATGGQGAGGLCQLVSRDVHERLLADDQVVDELPALLERARAARKADDKRRAAEAAAPAAVLQLSLPLASYAGTYRNEWFGTLTIAARGAGLVGHLGELALELRTPMTDGLRLGGQGAPDSEGHFVLADGKVLAVELDLDGPVRFTR
ncbi:MAG: serine hydrolase [Planctomycetes bacterium]|nr:serine hydrolase [Planctomycetota bacterium]